MLNDPITENYRLPMVHLFFVVENSLSNPEFVFLKRKLDKLIIERYSILLVTGSLSRKEIFCQKMFRNNF